MQITLYNNKTEKIRVIKNDYLQKFIEVEGTMRESTSITNPKFLIQFVDNVILLAMNCNYIYVPDFKRYYFVSNINVVNNKLLEFECVVDVLMSFKSHISQTTALISRNQYKSNPYIKDDLMVFDNKYVVEETEFRTPPAGLSFEEKYVSFDTNESLVEEDPNIFPLKTILCCKSDFDLETYFRNYGITFSNVVRSPVDALPDINREVFPPTGNDTYYGIFETDLPRILQAMYTDSSIASNVKSLIIYPFDIPCYSHLDSSSHNIVIGQSSIPMTDIAVPVYLNSIGYILNNSFIIKEKFGDYRDYAPYSKHELYLPYVGYIEVDPNLILTKKDNSEVKILKLVYSVDPSTGGASVILLSNDKIIYSSTCQLGIQVGLTTSNSLEIERTRTANNLNLINSIGMGAMSGVLGAYTGNPAFLAGAFTSISTGVGQYLGREQQLIEKANVNISSGNAGLYSKPQVQYRLSYLNRTIPDSELNKYAYTYGLPLFETSILMRLKGFTICEQVHLKYFPTATESELKQIEEMLKTGIIMPEP